MEQIKTDKGYILRLEKGEKITETLLSFAKEHNIQSAFITGLGAVNNTEIGVYHLSKKEYIKKQFPEDAEILNLTGNLSWFDGNPAAHVHVTLSDHNYNAFGGHLFEATTAVTVEIFITATSTKVERKYSEEIGLNLL